MANLIDGGSNSVLEDLYLENETGQTWCISAGFQQRIVNVECNANGTGGGVTFPSALASPRVTGLIVRAQSGPGIEINCDRGQFEHLRVTDIGSGEAALHITSTALGNILGNVQLNPGPSTGSPASLLIDGDENVIGLVSIWNNGGATYDISFGAASNNNRLGEWYSGSGFGLNDSGTGNRYPGSGGTFSGDLTASAGTENLGSSTEPWNALYAKELRDEAGTLVWDLSGDLTAQGDIDPDTDNSLSLGSAALSWLAAYLYDLYDEAGTKRLDLSGDWTPGGHIIPGSDNASDLGSAALSYKDLYAHQILDEAGVSRWDLSDTHPAHQKVGTDTIADTNSTVNVTHGLGATPSAVVVTPDGDERLWVTAIGATTFTVNRSGTSGARGFSWLALA